MRKTFLFLSLVMLCVPALGEESAVEKAPIGEAPPMEEAQPKEGAKAPTATAEVNVRLVELFNSEQLPGTGQLVFKVGSGEGETIPLGKPTGYYGLGMVFEGANLPDQYGRDFRGNSIIQIALGSVTSKLSGQLPQFGAATILTRRVPGKTTRYPFKVPEAGKKNAGDVAFLLFSSPITPNERSDEEKLKGTYFATGGTVTLSKAGKSSVKDVRWQGKRLKFTLQMMKVEMNADLVTPFSATTASLTGTLEFPVYTAQNEAAREMTQRIAQDSLRGNVKLPNSAPQRDVSGRPGK